MSSLKLHLLSLVACAASLVCVLAVPEDHRHAPHKTDRFTSDGAHNPVYDQEALLGSHKADDLSELPDDVRLKRLRNLAVSHDKNNNGVVEPEELKEWVMTSFRLLDREEAIEKFEEEDENADGKIAFEELLHKQFGYSPEELAKMQAGEIEEDEKDIFELIEDDKARFQAADVDHDGFLTDKEYMAFFQPYDYPHMFDVEMDKTMKQFDQNKDGLVSLDEFIGEETDEEERQASKISFEEYDKDKDGKLTSDEMRAFALPDNTESAQDEVDHLISVCDEDKDGKLSIDEIVTKEDEFLTSAATDYGRTLHFVRDEL